MESRQHALQKEIQNPFFCDAELSERIYKPDLAHQATFVASLGYRNDPSPFLTVEALLGAVYSEIAFVYFLNELGTLRSHIF